MGHDFEELKLVLQDLLSNFSDVDTWPRINVFVADTFRSPYQNSTVDADTKNAILNAIALLDRINRTRYDLGNDTGLKCGECLKEIEREWSFCPYCGEKFSDW